MNKTNFEIKHIIKREKIQGIKDKNVPSKLIK